MDMKSRPSHLAVLASAIFALAPPTARPQSEMQSQSAEIKVTSPLVLVDVMSFDTKTGLPVKSMERSDFELLDNNHPVPIESFDSGARYDTTPIDLWLIVICNEKSQVPGMEDSAPQDVRSGTFIGREHLLRPALDKLDEKDSVGVADWCDNGSARIDFRPTHDPDGAISALTQALQPSGFTETQFSDSRQGELACQRMILMILDDAHNTTPPHLPVLVFLHSDWTGMPRDELNPLVKEILETSAVVFGIKDSRVREMRQLRVEQGAIFHFLSGETGGQYLSVPSDRYQAALEEILLQLHFRYQLGFRPTKLDGKQHTLTVRLAHDTAQKFKSIRLRSRSDYIPKP
jgi:hypothetical protein